MGRFGSTVRCAVLGACASACSVPRAYQSPRTTPAGKISHSLALEVGPGFFDEEKREVDPLVASENPHPVAYSLRVGLAERWEVAGSAGIGLLASQVKWNFLRSRWFDAALAPRAQYFEPLVYSGSPSRSVALSLPVLMGFNVNRELSFILGPGMAHVSGYRSEYDQGEDDLSVVGESRFERDLVGSLAVDLEVRVSSRLTFHPGLTLYRRLSSGESSWQFAFAVGWGRMPFYGDVPP